MPSKSDVEKGVVRFVAVFMTVFAFELQRSGATTLKQMVTAAVAAIPLAIEKVFIGI